MSSSEVARYLQRAALDLEFNDLARTDPDASFEGYALSDLEKEILRRRDEEMIRLLAEASSGSGAPGRPADEERAAAGDPLPVAGQVLPSVDLILQLVAVPSRDDAGRLRLAHSASLHLAPAPGAPLPPPGGAPEGAMPPLRFRITVAPHASAISGGQVALTYAATILAHGAEEGGVAPATPGNEPPPPCGRRVPPEAAIRAAEAVKAAAPGDRRARLLDLVAALTGAGREA